MKNKYTNPPTISLLPTSISLIIEAATAEIANIATVVAVINENKPCCPIPNIAVSAILPRGSSPLPTCYPPKPPLKSVKNISEPTITVAAVPMISWRLILRYERKEIGRRDPIRRTRG